MFFAFHRHNENNSENIYEETLKQKVQVRKVYVSSYILINNR